MAHFNSQSISTVPDVTGVNFWTNSGFRVFKQWGDERFFTSKMKSRGSAYFIECDLLPFLNKPVSLIYLFSSLSGISISKLKFQNRWEFKVQWITWFPSLNQSTFAFYDGRWNSYFPGFKRFSDSIHTFDRYKF